MLNGRLRRRKSPLKQISAREHIEGQFGLVLLPEPLQSHRPAVSPSQNSLSPCPLHSSRSWQDRRSSGLRWGSPLRNKALVQPITHNKAQSLIFLEVTQPKTEVRIKTTDIKVPSFRKRLFRYVEKCSYYKKTEKKGAMDALAYVSSRKYRLRLVQSSLDSAQKRSLPLRRRKEDACVGGDDPLP